MVQELRASGQAWAASLDLRAQDRCLKPEFVWQKAVRWVLVMIALAISGSVLAMTFWPAVREDNRRIALATIVTIVLLHMLLSVGCLVRSHSDALLVCFRCHAKTSNCQTPWFFKSWLPGINIVLNRLCRMRNNSHENLVVSPRRPFHASRGPRATPGGEAGRETRAAGDRAVRGGNQSRVTGAHLQTAGAAAAPVAARRKLWAGLGESAGKRSPAPRRRRRLLRARLLSPTASLARTVP